MIKSLFLPILLCLVIGPATSFADIALVGKNRIVFEGNTPRISLNLLNQGKDPALVGTSIEWGDGREQPLPMVVSMPLIRIPQAQQNSLEIFYQGVGLPQDRESYFLLSVLDVPIAAYEENALQVALRHRYKLFYRPKLETGPQSAMTSLSWHSDPLGNLQARNTSPYYITLTDIELIESSQQRCGQLIKHFMIAPFSETALNEPDCTAVVAQVKYLFVSDSGREIEGASAVNQGETK